ncbi:MAG: carboxypeptidase M32 [Sphaerochaetaceae bacterium]|jgi:carboxypeptidase Taq|nr:carboxypeptidase M32 [Sphaerochaetaceae bacterium]
MKQDAALRRLEGIDKELVLLSHILGVLTWDQEAVPPRGVEERALQMGLLDRNMHELVASDEMGELLSDLGASDGNEGGATSLDDRSRGIIRNYFRLWRRERKLDSGFVQEFSETTGKAHQVWVRARSENKFSHFEPVLTHIVDLVQQKAEAFGYDDDPYDALLDVFEPGTTTAEVEKLFGVMKGDLLDILQQIGEKEHIDDTFLYNSYAQDKQEFFAREVLDAMGFDWERGLTGLATHPYTISLGSDDIRITTRYTEPSVTSPLFSTIHEGGHALYEMGASNERTKGTCLASGASLAFHESQSRLWENMIGRSRGFWQHFFPKFKALFPTQLDHVTVQHFVAAINKVQPSSIRVNADEVTYGLHIILRFELERELLAGTLAVRDLPGAWNEKMETLLGIRVEDDRVGVLQDVHWAMGELGYFPTYALGNLYGAQIMDTLQQEVDVGTVLSSGDFSPIRLWLDSHILQYGSMYPPKELLQKVTGAPLDTRFFKQYLTNKYVESM